MPQILRTYDYDMVQILQKEMLDKGIDLIVGDAIEVFNPLTHKPMMLQLAGPAQKQARQAADHIYGHPVRNTGYIGSSYIKVFDYNAASTGLTAAQCEADNFLQQAYRQVRVDQVRELVESNAYILDVRTEAMYAQGHLKNAVNTGNRLQKNI